MSVTIQAVARRSPAQKAGILSGEQLVSINGNSITDVLDYRFYMTEEHLSIELCGMDGARRLVTVDKGEYDDLGLEFETYLMDRQHTCKNKCIFCFVDQMPPGMRDTLYVKDDDSRMSFLFGNYITMTNLTDEHIDRIIKMRISPVNVSVHTTNPELRVRLMKNPKAADSLAYLRRLADAGIKLNTQLVLCPGINDGAELERSITELAALFPALESIACVPVGITKYREGLDALRTYRADEARAVIGTIHRFSDRFFAQYGERIVYPSDEFFLLAGTPLPDADYYGAFSQLENGVGLLSLLREEFFEALADADQSALSKPRHCTIATGAAAGEAISELVRAAKERFSLLACDVEVIQNIYFGDDITVTGLLTATDLIAQLSGKALGSKLLISSSMLRHEQDKFLDDKTIADLEQALGITVSVVDNSGQALLDHLLGI